MITCIDCDSELIDVFYKCTTEDYRYIDTNNNLIHIKTEHDMNDSEEINTQVKDIYCITCNKPVYYPTQYENNQFKNNDIIMTFFPHSNTKNLIHKFTTINCRYCNNNLQKGYFTINNNKIHIYNEETNEKIKEINIIETDITSISDTDIGKKILYCNDCNYFIMNNLSEFYKINN